MTMPQADFDPDKLELFWHMIAERQNVWYRRMQLKEKSPWTDDLILRHAFFTNVYRELDPATEWLRTNVLEQDDIDWRDTLFNVILFRFMGSQERTYKKVGLQLSRHFDPGALIDTLSSIPASFGDAYTVYANVKDVSKSKIENVALWAQRLIPQLGALTDICQECSPGHAFKAISSIEGMGPFLSYQVIVDLLYEDRRWDNFLDGIKARGWMGYATLNDFVVAGPGAKRGISHLLVPGSPTAMRRPRSEVELLVMGWLHQNQYKYLQSKKMKWLTFPDGSRKRLWLSDIQNCLCEFSKYIRVLEHNRITRKYRGGIG